MVVRSTSSLSPFPPPSASSSANDLRRRLLSRHILRRAVSHPPYAPFSDQPDHYLHSLLEQAEDSLQGHAANLLRFLGQLDPSKHSHGYLFLLKAYSCGPSVNEQGDEFLQCTVGFIDSCVAEKIRLAPEKFVSVCQRSKDKVLQLQDPVREVSPLGTAFQKLQPSSEHLTSLHPEFLFLCLLSKRYNISLSALKQEIFELDQPQDLVLFCYYGGMLNIGLKRFHKALEMLHNVITAPMLHLNAIPVEAYKKYILLSLVINVQIPQFPKYTSPTAARNLKTHTQLYVELANNFNSGKYSEFEQFIQSNVERFQQDNNLGLVKQVLASMYKRNIQRHTQTYLTTSSLHRWPWLRLVSSLWWPPLFPLCPHFHPCSPLLIIVSS